MLVEYVTAHRASVPRGADIVVHHFSRLDDVYAVPADWPPEMLAATG